LKTNSTKNKGGRPRNTVNDELADDMGISTRRLRQLISTYGLDQISDIQELQLLEKRALIAVRSFRAEREKRALEIERRELILKIDAEAWAQGISNVINRFVDEARTNWPSELAGKDEQSVHKILTRILAEFWEDIAIEAAKL
jgi:methionyl-tRNA synthetase